MIHKFAEVATSRWQLEKARADAEVSNMFQGTCHMPQATLDDGGQHMYTPPPQKDSAYCLLREAIVLIKYPNCTQRLRP